MMRSSHRRAIVALAIGLALVALGVTLLRIASLTQSWLLVLLSIPTLFFGIVRVADCVPKRADRRKTLSDAS